MDLRRRLRTIAPLLAVCAIAHASAGDAIDRAQTELRAGRFSEARDLAERILERHPEDVRARIVAATACVDRRQLRCAKEHVGALGRVASATPAYEILLGRLSLLNASLAHASQDSKLEQEHAMAAAAAFAEALALAPGQPETLGLRAKALLEAGRFAEAGEASKTWIDAAPRDSEAYATGARAFASVGAGNELGALMDRVPADPPEVAHVLHLTLLAGAAMVSSWADIRPLFDRVAAVETDPTSKLGLDAYRAMFTGDDPLPLLKALDYLDADPDDLLRVGSLARRKIPGRPEPASKTPGIVPPQIVHRVEPVLSDAQHRAKIEGRVLMLVRILKDGRVGSVHAISVSDPTYSKTAIDAVRGWTYEPATRDGAPIEYPYVIRMDFRFS